ncbi:MAG: DUF447 family protein [Alphaproteobacteria bacterium]|nr:DUF447 family protein [Alphaproteobacteria bacterium]
MIIESIITTTDTDGAPHIAPMGVIMENGAPVLAPFRPSHTLDNLTRSGCAVINHTDDVRVFAGCLTGRSDWPVRPAEKISGVVLEAALSHQELAVDRVADDAMRPRFYGRIVHTVAHRPFLGFNRAQAAVIEAAILVSRLHMLPLDKIEREMAYLDIAIGKTAGPREQEAWGWLTTHVAEYQRRALQEGAR